MERQPYWSPSKISDHTFISSQVVVSGFCKIGEACFVGVNSTLADHVKIASEGIGAGTVVTKDVNFRNYLEGKPCRSVWSWYPSILQIERVRCIGKKEDSSTVQMGSSWAKHSFMTPDRIWLDNNIIRIFGGLRDDDGVSRIGYLDVDSKPKAYIGISKEPVLGGEHGNFDDNGVILGDVLEVGSKLYMYYVGFQLARKVKF